MRLALQEGVAQTFAFDALQELVAKTFAFVAAYVNLSLFGVCKPVQVPLAAVNLHKAKPKQSK